MSIVRLLTAMLIALLPVTASAKALRVSPTAPHAYRTVHAAIDALPAFGGEVRIDPGTYREKLWITKPNVHLVGTGKRPGDVVLVYGDSSANVGDTYNTPSVYVAGDGFRADNLTFANDWNKTHANAQAVALAVSGDRAVFSHVRILGNQDTLYLVHPQNERSRQYFSDCYVEGHVDFVFGNAKAYFHRCELHGLKRANIFFTAQSRDSPTEDSAFVFDHCRLTGYAAPGGVFLGRAWRPYARVIWLNTQIDIPVDPRGWREWYPDRSKTLLTAYYAEYRSTGIGASPSTREPHAHILTDAEAAQWSLSNFFHGDTGWIRLPSPKPTN